MAEGYFVTPRTENCELFLVTLHNYVNRLTIVELRLKNDKLTRAKERDTKERSVKFGPTNTLSAKVIFTRDVHNNIDLEATSFNTHIGR